MKKIKKFVEIVGIFAMLSAALVSTVLAEVPGVPRGFHLISGDGSVTLA